MGWFEGKRLGPTWSGQIQWPGVGGVCWILNGGRDGYTALNYIEQFTVPMGGPFVNGWTRSLLIVTVHKTKTLRVPLDSSGRAEGRGTLSRYLQTDR